jgi:hypothetical protein
VNFTPISSPLREPGGTSVFPGFLSPPGERIKVRGKQIKDDTTLKQEIHPGVI